MTDSWRLIYNKEANVADLLAVPSAVAEGRLAGRYIMAAHATPETVIIQHVGKKGILAGAEVMVDHDEAEKRGIDIAVQPRAGRASTRPAKTISFTEMMLKANDECPSIQPSDNDLAALIYTSGTTGLPKGVMLSNRNFIAECEVTESVIKTGSEDRFASLVPFFHVFGLADACVLALYRGLCSLCVPHYHPRRFLKTISEKNIAVILAIPSQYRHLMMAARRRFSDDMKKPELKYCISGAAPLPLSVIESFKEIFNATIIEGYGMTESTSAVAVNPPGAIKPGSIGLPLPGVKMRLIDEAGRDVPPVSPGEIIIQGPMVSQGYYNLPDDTKETFIDGWLRSGDIGYQDDDGYYFITDRKKDVIIKGGFNISPKEIEDLLVQHPKIREAAVVGIQRRDEKEDIKAYCVVVEGETVQPEEIIDYCRKTLASYKTPDEVAFIDALPKSMTGKLLRRELRGDFKDLRIIEQEP